MISFFSTEIDEPPWCWIAEMGQGKVWLGVHSLDGWVIRVSGRVKLIENHGDCAFLLPLLEYSRAWFYKNIEQFLVVSKWREKFPEALLLSSALNYPGSDYWASKALDWIGDNAREIPALDDVLKDLVIRKSWAQGVRQRISRLKRNVGV
ncbi:hypothetical protein [Variovorax sp. MHTC-1]|uniref:hypothetical protein n=1 Tax=Variovorax sp. MHTC-1 TaxID=2495593 RepID=UPI000F87D8A7|nr:hypothetical protein [Variovorax sp. MHTC-1]RST50674.1 hypothetical protein EJI01_21380 [Variovorax sp. MHTC-1]